MARRGVLLLAALGALVAFVSTADPAGAADEFDRYALESASASLSTNQAGAHADVTTSFSISQTTEGGQPKAFALTREVEVALPVGVIGNPQALPRCTIAQLGNLPEESDCPIASQVGVTEIEVGGEFKGTFVEPIYDMESPGGDIVARLGFYAVGYPAFINVRVESDRLQPRRVDRRRSLRRRDPRRANDPLGRPCRVDPRPGTDDAGRSAAPGNASGPPRRTPGGAFHDQPDRLRDPPGTSRSRRGATSCQARPRRSPPPIPKSAAAEASASGPRSRSRRPIPKRRRRPGSDADLGMPQDESPGGRATSTLKSAVVALPEGLTVNAAAADGLEACSAAQVGFELAEPSHCPAGAKIGSVELDVPALEHTFKGSAYQRTPEPGHLFRFWLVTDEEGVHLKLPAEIEANPLTGQLTTVFAGIPAIGGNPQVPVADLRLHIFGGPRAPLATPGACGTYRTHFSFVPWSGKAAAEGETPMSITVGCGKGGFRPSLSAGTLSARAGSYSPFTLTVTRADGEANPTTLSATLPEGVVAKLAGVPLCPEAAAAAGECPAASQVGTVAVATGVGGAPLWVPQPGKEPTAVFLAGPYKGAPYSIVVKVPAQAGPFDLGTVLTRAGIYVDPTTAVVTVKSDPLPQILEGVPLTYRAVSVTIDRPEFTLNATNCSPLATAATLTATTGAVADLTAPYQATNCARLGFQPTLKLSFSGGTKRLGHPVLKAVLTQPKGQNANLAKTTVILPKGTFIDPDPRRQHLHPGPVQLHRPPRAKPARPSRCSGRPRSGRRCSRNRSAARSTSAPTAAKGNSPTSSSLSAARSRSSWWASSTRSARRGRKYAACGPASRTSPTPRSPASN